MSLSQKQNEVSRTLGDIATLRRQMADAQKAESANLKEADTIRRSITKSTSESSLRQKQQKLTKLADDFAKISDKQAGISKKLADKNTQLGRQQDGLNKEEARERKKVMDADKKREREQLEYQRNLTRELHAQRELILPPSLPPVGQIVAPQRHDAFISHASEDKEDFVRPLAEALIEAGFDIWYDEMTLKVGDSLRQSIDRGLSQSRFGIVVLSTAFFSKNWTQYELNGLVTREMTGGKVILPIWHKVSKDDVLAYSPTLADKVAINSSLSSRDKIVAQLSEVLKA